MKPTPEFIQNKHRAGDRNFTRVAAQLPKIDCHYQAPFVDFSSRSHGNGKSRPSFRGISEHYFNTEARGHFATEAAVFAVILLTAAVPVIQGVRAIAQFVPGML